MKPTQAVSKLRALNRRTATRLKRVRQIEARWERLADRGSNKALGIISDWIAAQVQRIGASGCIFGASGGVDSSLVAVLLARAIPKQSLALILPCAADPDDEADAVLLLKRLHIRFRVIDIAPLVEATVKLMGRTRGRKQRLIAGNLASRLRQDLLYYEANRSNRLVVGTGDLDETYIGYSSKGATADLFPITGLHKEEVRALLYTGLEPIDPTLAERLAQKPASPGYWPGQDAEDELGLAYSRIGRALDVIIGQCQIDESGLHPWDPAELTRAIGHSGVAGEDLLAVAELVMRNHHKSFGSPALWRPEPYAQLEDEHD